MGVENISEIVEVVKETAEVVKEITEAEKDYVSELLPTIEEWNPMEESEKISIVGQIFDRLVELGFVEPTDQIKAIVDVCKAFEQGDFNAADIIELAVKGGVLAAGTYFGCDLQTSAQLAEVAGDLVKKLLESDSDSPTVFIDPCPVEI